MKVKVVQDFPNKWEFQGVFPTFAKGTPVALARQEDDDFPGWYACEIEGHRPFVPILFVRDGKLCRDYNPTELIQKAGDVLEVREIVQGWLVAQNAQGAIGWITADAVASINE